MWPLRCPDVSGIGVRMFPIYAKEFIDLFTGEPIDKRKKK
jgi:hypothetical protein